MSELLCTNDQETKIYKQLFTKKVNDGHNAYVHVVNKQPVQ